MSSRIGSRPTSREGSERGGAFPFQEKPPGSNRDGWPDLYVGNDYGLPNFFYISGADGSFTDRRVQYFPELDDPTAGAAGFNATMGQALCDYDRVRLAPLFMRY